MIRHFVFIGYFALIALLQPVHGRALDGHQQTTTGSKIKSVWLSYSDKDGFSFRYPPSLTVKVEDVPEAHQFWQSSDEHWDREVSLIGDTPINPGSKVLVFRHIMVTHWMGNPLAPSLAGRVVQLQKQCDTVNRLQMTKTIGYVCNTHGRGARHWDVYTLEPYILDISNVLVGADYDDGAPPPHDGRFPLLSILGTVSVQRPHDGS